MARKRMYELHSAIRTLHSALDNPRCDCNGPPHEPKCEAGRVVMLARLDALRWAIGHTNNFEGILAGLREMQKSGA